MHRFRAESIAKSQANANRKSLSSIPPRTNFDCEELAPRLGLIRLAQVALRCGAQVAIEDYNLLWHLDEGDACHIL